ncbi:alpha/beta hydrolase [Pseudovibrio sp. Tun.PSC04-5.I4]|uniref:alpha/beta hydrolase n=1 Tax=Pseudovibrio sp. Tun.PSC04-5.I4 TaxID=1798213 RepID=UPI000881F528|nr:alpha/beta hydrolase [Pseudovibrio sp. Tun.PSC04-5.I4]SDQ18164.1 Pimeloyl-ACP methyl ester carboxylesterase [Pseudovibrio sp. Tun.PSC04-5.I4]
MRSEKPIQRYVDAGDHRICLHEWTGKGPAFLLLHATGFHGRLWDYIINRFPNRHVIAWDMRSHGLSEKAALPEFWSELADDLFAVIDDLQLKQIYGVGHSCGGHLAIMAAAKYPDLFKSLLLLDPVVFPKQLLPIFKKLTQQDHPVARRRNDWDDADEMFNRFKDRTPYSRWIPEVLRDYCKYGLAPSDRGEGYQLACPPTAEAAVYQNCYGDQIYSLLETVQTPTTVVRAKRRTADQSLFDFSSSPTWELLAENMGNAKDIYLPNQTHFLPMENPQAVLNMMVQMERGAEICWHGNGAIIEDA